MKVSSRTRSAQTLAPRHRCTLCGAPVVGVDPDSGRCLSCQVAEPLLHLQALEGLREMARGW